MTTTETGNKEKARRKEISAEFPFEPNFVAVDGSEIHYVDVGEGDPILFLHGNPTWSYLWRNIIPHLQPEARCIAPDLIGMGKSGKPEIDYTFEDHYEYIEAFIDELGLKDITLVVHDWGSGIGFQYAHTHPGNVTGLALMEAIVRPWKWEQMELSPRLWFRLMRTPVVGWGIISVANMFVNGMLPRLTIRDLTDEELDRYREPYPTVASRKPVRVWPREVPISGKPARVHDKVAAYSKWLTETEIPKLCLYADPGAIIRHEEVSYIERNFANKTMVNIGEGLHYVQEDHPHRIGEEIASWYTNF
jgi:haloalkane dehalogenase